MSNQTERLDHKLKHNNWSSFEQTTKIYEELRIISWRLDEIEHYIRQQREQKND